MENLIYILIYLIGVIIAYFPTKWFLLQPSKGDRYPIWDMSKFIGSISLSLIGSWFIVAITIFVLLLGYLAYLALKIGDNISKRKPPKWS